MKTIPLLAAIAILENASAVIIDQVVTYPGLDELTGAADNQFLELAWSDEEGLEFTERFKEGANATARISGSSLWLVNEHGEEAQITILVPANLEAAAAEPIAPR